YTATVPTATTVTTADSAIPAATTVTPATTAHTATVATSTTIATADSAIPAATTATTVTTAYSAISAATTIATAYSAMTTIATAVTTTPMIMVTGVVMVDIDSAMPPVPASPSTPPTHADSHPGGKPDGAHPDNDSGRVNRRVEKGRILGVRPSSVDHGWIVNRNVDDRRVNRLDHDLLSGHDHLFSFGGLEIAGYMRLLAQSLDGIHDIFRLIQESVTHILGPCDLLGHHPKDLRERRQRLDTGVPGRLVRHVQELIAAKGAIAPDKVVGGFYIAGIPSGQEDLPEQRIGIKGDRCKHLVKFRRAEHPTLRLCDGRGRQEQNQESNHSVHSAYSLAHEFLLSFKKIRTIPPSLVYK
ncbi:MAG: hypothetical protein WAW37_13670, partial [Syntrophobacteraceae bacterium]